VRPPRVTAWELPDAISPDELRTQLDLGSLPTVIDVRSGREHASGHVPGAISVPLWKVLVFGLPDEVSRTEAVVVYCGRGPRARMAMFGLRLRGFSNVCELDGHWLEWERRQYPVARGARP